MGLKLDSEEFDLAKVNLDFANVFCFNFVVLVRVKSETIITVSFGEQVKPTGSIGHSELYID